MKLQLMFFGIIFLMSEALSWGAQAVPGRVEFEDFNTGGEAVAYHDSEKSNLGTAYRQEGVDVYALDKGYAVGWVAQGEWLKLDLQVKESLYYRVTLRTGVPSGASYVKLLLNGVPTGSSLQIPLVKNFREFDDLFAGTFYLPAGRQTLLVNFEKSGSSGWVGDFDYINFEAVGGGTGGPSLDRSQIEAQVKQLYRDVLDREADVGGLNSFSDQMMSGKTAQEIRQILAFSQESINNLNSLFQTFLLRAPSPGELKNFQEQLATDKKLSQIRIIVSERN